jgi:hypothetical protein
VHNIIILLLPPPPGPASSSESPFSPQMSSGSGSLVPPPADQQPPEAAPSNGEPNVSGNDNDDSESSAEKAPRVMWNYYFEKPHSSQYIPGAKAVPPAGAQPNVESFTQNLKLIGKVGVVEIIMHSFSVA